MQLNGIHKYLSLPLTYETLHATLAELQDAYPRLRVATLAYSICGRRIPYLMMGEGEKTVLYVAAHHAMEWLTGNLLLAFAYRLLSGETEGDQKCKSLLRRFRFVLIPQLNPDGVSLALEGANPSHPLYHRQVSMNGGEDFSHWQANARGVDLNHNYSVGFHEYRKLQTEKGILSGAPTLYAGEYPESEPESAALAGLIRILHPAIILTLHTQGEEIYYDATRATPQMHKMAKHLSRLTGYALGIAEGTAAYGGLTEWAVGCGIPSFTLECGKGQNPLPLSQAPDIYESLKEALFTAPTLIEL